MNHLIPNLYGEYEEVQKAATQEVPEADPSDRLQISHDKKSIQTVTR